MRVLGGSIGIAASTAILGVTQRGELAGLVSASQLASLETSIRTLTPMQVLAVRKAYSDAFTEDLRVCAAVAGACVLLTFGTFQRNPPSLMESRKQKFVDEARRVKAQRETEGQSSS